MKISTNSEMRKLDNQALIDLLNHAIPLSPTKNLTTLLLITWIIEKFRKEGEETIANR